MTGGRRFSLSSPDWGQDHLSLDAIVAYVDDELAAGAHDRADAHLACCVDCRAEVVAQIQARSVLRAAAAPNLPSSLLHSLRCIPVEAELPPPPPGLGITPDGQFVLLRDVPRAAPDVAPPGPAVSQRRLSRRTRTVSGLAFGALAVGALAVPGLVTAEAPDVLGGVVVRDVPAQARLSPVPEVPAVSPAVAGGLRSAPIVADPSATGAVEDGTTPAVSRTDAPDVVDARLRAELDRRPAAFFHTP
jgi:hypothetical protein